MLTCRQIMLFTYVKADTFKTVKPRGGGEGRQRAQESRGALLGRRRGQDGNTGDVKLRAVPGGEGRPGAPATDYRGVCDRFKHSSHSLACWKHGPSPFILTSASHVRTETSPREVRDPPLCSHTFTTHRHQQGRRRTVPWKGAASSFGVKTVPTGVS